MKEKFSYFSLIDFQIYPELVPLYAGSRKAVISGSLGITSKIKDAETSSA
jgi:hypothetical protein